MRNELRIGLFVVVAAALASALFTASTVTANQAADNTITLLAPCDSGEKLDTHSTMLNSHVKEIFVGTGFIWVTTAHVKAANDGDNYVLSLVVKDKNNAIVATGLSQSKPLNAGQSTDLATYAGISPDVPGSYHLLATLWLIRAGVVTSVQTKECTSTH
jgi:hypothetical protein